MGPKRQASPPPLRPPNPSTLWGFCSPLRLLCSALPQERRITNRENTETEDFERVCFSLLGRLSQGTTDQVASTTEMFCLMLGAGNSRPSRQQDGSLQGCKGESVPGSSPWLVDVHPLCVSPSHFLSLHVCVSAFSPFRKGTGPYQVRSHSNDSL